MNFIIFYVEKLYYEVLFNKTHIRSNNTVIRGNARAVVHLRTIDQFLKLVYCRFLQEK